MIEFLEMLGAWLHTIENDRYFPRRIPPYCQLIVSPFEMTIRDLPTPVFEMTIRHLPAPVGASA